MQLSFLKRDIGPILRVKKWLEPPPNTVVPPEERGDRGEGPDPRHGRGRDRQGEGGLGAGQGAVPEQHGQVFQFPIIL